MANLKIIAPAAAPGLAHTFKTVNVVKTGAGFKVHNQVTDGTHGRVYIATPSFTQGFPTLCIPNYTAP